MVVRQGELRPHDERLNGPVTEIDFVLTPANLAPGLSLIILFYHLVQSRHERDCECWKPKHNK